MSSPAYSAVLFDLDGVIIDSMPYHFFAWYEALKKYGITVNTQDIYEHEGEKWDSTLQTLAKQSGQKLTDQTALKIFQYRQKIFHKIFKCHLMPGLPELIAELKNKGYRLGIVSGTPSTDIKKLLPPKLLKLFDCLVGGDTVAQGKPAPEPYRQAAQLLGLTPEKCLAIENSPLGIASAKSAGCFCLAVTTSLPENYLKKADVLCPLKNLREVLLNLL